MKLATHGAPTELASVTPISRDSFDSPILLKVRDVVEIGGRLFYLRKITQKDYIFRPVRRDQVDQIRQT